MAQGLVRCYCWEECRNEIYLVNRQTALLFGEEMWFQRFRKSSFEEMFWFCIHLVHCETAAYFLMINSVLNNEVGKLTGELCVHE